MALSVLAYNLTRVVNIMGVQASPERQQVARSYRCRPRRARSKQVV
jgi:hypothetical protein